MRKASAVLAVALAAILGAAVSAEDKPVASTPPQTAREWPATAAEIEGLRGLEREFRELQARSSAFLACVRDRLHAEVQFSSQRGAWVEVAPVGSK